MRRGNYLFNAMSEVDNVQAPVLNQVVNTQKTLLHFFMESFNLINVSF